MNMFRAFEHQAWEDAEVCAAYHDRLGEVVVQVIEPMLDALSVGAADRVLDVATGTGLAAAAAAGRGAAVVGIDFSDQQLRRARTTYPRLRFERGDADALPFDQDSFDVVVSNFGVPHFPDPDACFREAQRVLSPRGRFAFTVWAAPPETKGFEAVYGAIQQHGTLDVGLPAGPNFFLYADPDQARNSLTAAGFNNIRTVTVAQTWRLTNADELFESILHGTVRAAAVLQRQPPEVLNRIRQSVSGAMNAYAHGGIYQVPMPAVLTTAAR